MMDRKLRNYFTALASTIAVLAVAAASLTIAVDPYRMWDTREIAGFNAMKPRVDQQHLLAKTYMLERHTPKTLLLGNSRIEVGLDPESPLWPDAARPAFNAGIAGADLSIARGLLRDTAAREPLDTIIVGVDFVDFLGRTPRGPSPDRGRSPAEGRLMLTPDGQVNPERRSQAWKDGLSTTLTIDAVMDSLVTLMDQRPNVSNTMTRDGFNPLFPYRAEVEHNGYYELFRQKQVAYEQQYDGFAVPNFSNPDQNVEFGYVAEILRLAASRNVKVVLFIYPYHSSYLDMVADKGLWTAFEDWKRALVRVVDRQSSGRRDLVKLWDFSGYSPYSLEAIPPRGDTHSKMKWYWEAGHYTSDLGNVLIGVMMQGRTEFGHRLDSSNIEDVLAAIRAERASASLTRVRAELPHS
jgi:hypothetical protein